MKHLRDMSIDDGLFLRIQRIVNESNEESSMVVTHNDVIRSILVEGTCALEGKQRHERARIVIGHRRRERMLGRIR